MQNDTYASTQYTLAEDVDSYHRSKWNFISLYTNKYGGYNFFIDRMGRWTQFRAIGEETIAQRGYNFNTISFCLAGNFIKRDGIPIDFPSPEQIQTYKTLAISLLDNNPTLIAGLGIRIVPNTVIDIPFYNIHPHSYYDFRTQCNCLPDHWGREPLYEHIKGYGKFQAIYAQILEFWVKLTRFKKLGGVNNDCTAERD